MSRWVEFFEGDDGRLSMMRLTIFLSFWPATYVLIENPGEGMMGWYLGAFVLGYVGGKTTDIFMKPKGKRHVDNEPDSGSL